MRLLVEALERRIMLDGLDVTTQPPSSIVAGKSFGVVVSAESSDGTVNTSFDGSLSITDADGYPLNGTTTVNAVNGVAIFSDISEETATTSDSLNVSGDGLPTVATSSFTVTAASATQLVTLAPSGAAANGPFRVTVDAEDQYGNVAPTFNGNITLSLVANPGQATLGGTLNAQAVNGIATFSGLTVNKIANGYVLQASSNGLTSGIAVPLDVTRDQLVVTTEPPAGITAGGSFGLVATAEDGQGNVDASFTGNATVSSVDGRTLGGTLTVQAVNGVATFLGLSETTAGADSLAVSSYNLAAGDTNGLSVNPAAAASLVIATPGGVVANDPFSLTVNAEDQYGNAASTFNGNVTLSLESNLGSATLGGTLTVQAVNGLATFSGLTINKLGTGYVVQATSTGLTNASAEFNVTDQLVVTTPPPSSIAAGSPFGLVVTAEDGQGNVDTSFTGNVSVYSGNYYGSLSGNLTVNAVDGVATFSDLTTISSGYQALVVSSNGLPSFYTNYFFVTPQVATQLSIAPPGDIFANGPFTLTISAEDQYGNTDPTFSGNVTLSLGSNPGGATLGGSLTAQAVNGIATFPGLTIDKLGTGYIVQASAAGLNSTTTEFNVTDQLVVTTPPPGAIAAGSPFGLVVTAEDGQGNVDISFTGSVSVYNNYYYGALRGTLTVQAVNGVATFSGLAITESGNQNLGFSSGLLPNFYTANFDVTAQTAAQLSIASPGNAVANGPFNVTVFADDQYGNIDPSFNGNVTLSLGSNPDGGTLSGTLTTQAVNGIATFPGLTIDKVGNGYTLNATSTGLANGSSSSFDVTDQLVVTTPPLSTVTAGSPFGLVVTAEDGQGNVDASFSGNVSVDGALGGTIIVQAIKGVATFSGLTITGSGHHELAVSSSGLPNSYTTDFDVTAQSATQLSIIPLGNVVANGPFSLTVNAEDQYGNIDPTFNGDVTLSLGSGSGGAALGGTLTVQAINGVATFSGLSMDKPGAGYAVEASSTGLTSATTELNVTDQLVVTTQPPSTVTAGRPFGLVVTAEDGQGNVDTSFSGIVTITSADYYFDLGGTLTARAVNGVATFSGLTINTALNNFFLYVASTGLAEAYTDNLTVEAAAATQLVATAPYGVVANGPFGLTFYAEDQYDNVDPTFNGNVTLSLESNPNSATLGGTLTAQAVNGVATFSGLSINKLGTGYTVQATSTGLTSATTEFNVTDQLVVTTQPPSAIAASSPFGLVVTAEDGQGNVDTSFTGSVTVSGYGTLGGTLTVQAVNGVAVFSGLTIALAGNQDLGVTSSGLPYSYTNNFNVTAQTATQLSITAPGNVLANAPFNRTVNAEDQFGNVDPTFNGNVTLSLGTDPTSATLGGTLTVQAVNGVATFSNLSINMVGNGYTLSATSTGLTNGATSSFDVTGQLVVTTQPPSAITAGSPFGLVVTAEDGLGNIDTSFNGSVTVNDVYGYRLGGTLTIQAVDGVATFSGLTQDTAGAQFLEASSSGLPTASAGYFYVTPRPATHLSFTPPGNELANGPFSLTVSAEDQYGNVDPTFNGEVTLSLESNPGGATLGGALTVEAVNGVATFFGLSITKPGTGYTVQATSAGQTGGTAEFNVTDQLVVTTQPPSTLTVGSPFGLVVTAEDGQGNVDTSFTGSVTINSSYYYGYTLDGTLTVQAVNGVATFSGLSLTTAGSIELSIVSSGLPTAYTNKLTATAASATQLVATTPSGVLANGPFNMTVDAEDPDGNLDLTFNGNVTLSLGANPGGATLGGVLTVQAVNGVATFSGLTINKLGDGYTVIAASTGLTSGTTSDFDVTDQLVLTTQPPRSIPAGSPFGFVVQVEDGQGNIDTSFTGSVTVASDFYTLGGTLTAQAVNGVATFSGLTEITPGVSDYLYVSSDGLSSIYSNVFTITEPTAQVETWTGGGDGKSWNDPNNWSSDTIPGSTDTVVINAASATINLTTPITVLSVSSLAGLDITGGLTVTSGQSSVSGTLTLASGAGLTATGSATTLQVAGATTINGGDVYALSGATISLPGVTTIDQGYSEVEASGDGSEMNLGNLQTIGSGSVVSLLAKSGGQIDMPSLSTIAGVVNATAEYQGSSISVPVLTSFNAVGNDANYEYNGAIIDVSAGGQIIDPELVTAVNIEIEMDANSSLDTAQITDIAGSYLDITGGSPDFASVTTADGATLDIAGGAILSLPMVTTYTVTNDNGTSLYVSGSGSEISLPGLETLDGGGGYGTLYGLYVTAASGGSIDLPALSAITGAVDLSASGNGSSISMPVLTSFVGSSNSYTTPTLTDNNGGQVTVPELVTADDININLGSSTSLSTAQLTDISNSTLNLDGVAPNFGSVTNANGASFDLSGGAVLSLPLVATYSAGSSDSGEQWQVSGSGTLLSLPSLNTLNGNVAINTGPFGGGPEGFFDLTASAGGVVQLPLVTAMTTGSYTVTATGAGSAVELPLLTTLAGTNGPSALDTAAGGEISTAAALNLTTTDVTIGPAGMIESDDLLFEAGSTLAGTGTLVASVMNNGGTVSPGGNGTAGTLTIQGNYSQAAGGSLQVDIGGTTAGAGYDQLVVTGTVFLAGTLELGIIGGFSPATGDMFTLVTAVSVSGGFTLVTGGGIQAIELDPAYTATAVTLTADTAAGPYVTATSLPSETYQPFSSIDVTFDKGVNASTFTTSEASLTGPAGAVTISSVTQVSANVFQIDFATQSMPGQYQLSVGPDITDFAGNDMDQAQNGTVNGYTASATAYLPYLAPRAVTTTPSSAMFTGPIQVSWTDQNQGDEPTAGGETDNIYLSSSTSLNSSSVLIRTNSLPTQPLIAGAQTSLSATATLPAPSTSLTPGTYYIIIQSAASGNVAVSSPMQLTEPPLPDLQVTGVSGPATGSAGQTVLVTWTDANTGPVAAAGSWVDSVYVATDAQGDQQTLVGAFPLSTSLEAGSTVQRTQQVILPGTAGTYWFVVTTNTTQTLYESNFSNDTSIATSPVVVSQVPLPDLHVTSITPPPNGVFSGTSVPISFVVTNNGSGPTSVPVWRDWVIVSQDPTLAQTYSGQLNPTGPGGDQTLNNQPVIEGFNNPSYLGVGQSYVQNVNVTLPQTAQGTWYIYVVPDGTGYHHPFAMPEASRTDKLAISAGFNVTLSPVPSLTVTSVQAPSQEFSGQPISLSWTVANDGAAPTAVAAWTDAVYISQSPILDSSAIQVGTLAHQGVLAVGNSYTASDTVTLPVGISGSYYFLVKTDVDGQVFEGGATGGEVGTTSTTETVNLTPPPDLEMGTITVPATALAGHNLTFTYTTTNAGAGGTPNDTWVDSFYLSPTAAFDSSTAISLGQQTHYGSLAVGASYTNTVTESVPAGLSGAYYLLAMTDSGNVVFEVDKSNNLGASASPIQITSMLPDLVVSSVNGPATGVPGSAVLVTYTVTNQGAGDTGNASWQDDIYIENSETLDANATLLTSVAHSATLAAGDSYTQTATVTLPASLVALGSYNLFVVCNATDSLSESNTGNNTSSPEPITLQSGAADLQVASVTSPSTAVTGGSVTVSWTTDNNGSEATNSNYWYDDVWMSTNTTLDSGGTDVYLGTVQRGSSLAAGGSYTASGTFTIPQGVAAGSYYFIVDTNRTVAPPGDTQGVELVYESSYSNNETAESTPTAVSVATTPELTVSDIVLPTTASAGGPLSVGWTVTNSGTAVGSPIVDSVYLSFGQVLDSSARYLGSATYQAGLGNGASYTQNATFQLPSGVAGTFYVIVQTNSDNSIFEGSTTGGTAASAQTVNISLPTTSDLVAGAVSIPASGLAGQDATVSYQVSNDSSSPANGSWTDAIYLSPTPTYSPNDPLLGTVAEQQDLAPGGSYMGTLTAPLPGVAPGNYYVILRTNILNSLPESTLSNNLSASSTQISIDAPALTLGTPQNGTLAGGQSIYYKVVVPADETLEFTLTSQQQTSANDLYVSYGTMPIAAEYDYTDDQPLAANQQLKVPNTQAGTYYVLLYGSSVPSGSENFSLTATAVSFSVGSIIPAQVDNGGPSTIEIDGARFDRGTTFDLIGSANNVVPASAVYFQDPGTVYATFDLTNQAPGTYTLQATSSTGAVTTLSSDLTIVAAGPLPVVDPTDGAQNGALETYLVTPTVSLPSRIGGFQVDYVNLGDHDLVAPLLTVTSPTGTSLGLTPTNVDSGVYLSFLGTSTTGPAGILRPGESESRTVYFKSSATSGVDNTFQLQVLETGNTDPLDLQPYLPASTLAAPNFAAIYAQLQLNIGDTWGDYVTTLANEATLLPPVTGDNTDPLTLLDLAVTQATAQVNASISGVATADDPDVALAGQTVEAINQTTGETYSTYALNDGSFIFPSVTAATYSFSFDGAIINSPPTVTVSSAQAVTGVSLDLTAGATLTGQILQSQLTTPISGAAVEAIGSAGTEFTATTNSAGEYVLDGLPPDTYTLIATAAGFAQALQENIVLTTGSQTLGLAMTPQSVITGSVNPAAGGPAGGNLEVEAQPVGVTDPNQEYFATVSGEGFTLDELPAGTYSVSISLPGYVPVTLSRVTVAVGATVDVGASNLTIAASISGTVESTDPNTPAANEMVGLYSGTTLVASAVSDSNGAFDFTGLAAGIYTASVNNSSPLETDPTVTVATGGNVAGANIVVVPGGVVEGQATNANGGGPLMNVDVSLTDSTGNTVTETTDESGDFDFSGLVAGTYQLALQLTGPGASASVVVTATDGTIVTRNLSAAFSGILEGVVDDGQGNPEDDATVSLMQSGEVLDAQTTDDSGTYLFYLVQPGVYQLQASSQSAAFPLIDGIQVNANSTIVQNITAGTGSLNLSITDPSNTVVGDAVSVYLSGTAGPVLCGSATLDASGKTIFNNLTGGTYLVQVQGTNDTGASMSTTVPSSGVASYSISLAQQFQVSGVITDALHNPIPQAAVELLSTSDPSIQFSIAAGADGSYLISNVPNGIYDLTVYLDGFAAYTQSAISINSSVVQNVVMSSSNSTLSGTVVDGDGNPIANASVIIKDSGGHVIGMETTNTNGTFASTSVVGTKLEVDISTNGYASVAVAGVNAPPGAAANLGSITLQPLALADPPGGGSGLTGILQKPLEWVQALTATINFLADEVTSSPTLPDLSDPPACAEPDAYLDDLREAALNARAQVIASAAQVHDANVSVLQELGKTSLYATADAALIASVVAGTGGGLYAATLKYTPELIDMVQIFGRFFTAKQIQAFYAASGFLGAVEAQFHGWISDLNDITSATKGQWEDAVIAADSQLNYLLSEASAAASYISSISSSIANSPAVKVLLSNELGLLNAVLSVVTLRHGFSDAQAEADLAYGDVDKFYDSKDAFDKAYASALELSIQYNLAVANASRDGVCHPQPPMPPSNPPPGKKTGGPGGMGKTPTGSYHDPNSILGPLGFGTQQYVPLSQALPYTIAYENEPTATLPVPQVTITQQLDPNLDWRTFRLGDFGWGGMIFQVPANSSYYQTQVDLTATDGYYVDVTATINVVTGIATWVFTTIDPATGEIPVDPSIGFLPPDDANGSGEGFVSYTVMANQIAPTGTVINAQATVTFSNNPPIDTPQIFNTLDSGAGLSSSVALLPATETSDQFDVSWSGTDAENSSAINSYSIFVSTNSGPYVEWLANTSLTSAPFVGQPGDSYAFYSIAYDNVGNVQPTPASAQAVTLVAGGGTAFSGLTAPSTATFGAPNATFSGTVSAGSLFPPDTESVAVTLNGVTVDVPIGANGQFSAVFSTESLPASGTPYQVTYSYAGDSSFAAVSDDVTSTLTVSQARPTLVLPAAPSLVYDGTTDVTAWAAPALAGVSGATTPTNPVAMAFYTGPTAVGTPLTSPPVNSGTYTVVATYGGDSNYTGATSDAVTFTVNPAPTTTTLASLPESIIANGTTNVTSWVAATVTGVAGAPAPSGVPTYTYYSGPSGTGTPLASSPTNVGTYTVVASYGGNSNYLPSSASTTFTIDPAVALTTTMLVNGLPSTGSIANTQRSQVTSLVINFSAPVTLSAGAITLTDQDPSNPFGGAGASVPFTLTSSNGGETYTLTFSGAGFINRGSLATSLPNGHYSLNVNFSLVSSAAAVPSGSQTLNFHRLYGDLINAGYITTVVARTDASATNWATYEQYLDNDAAVLSGGFDGADSSALTAAETFVTGTQEQNLWNLYNG